MDAFPQKSMLIDIPSVRPQSIGDGVMRTELYIVRRLHAGTFLPGKSSKNHTRAAHSIVAP